MKQKSVRDDSAWIIIRLMPQLTRQEQLMVAMIMLALIVGGIVRIYHYSHPPVRATATLLSNP